MIYSMTGFAVATADLDSGSLTLELRSVNSRYLDLQLRIPEELRAAEPALRDTITTRLSRGKVECRINFSARNAASNSVQLNQSLLQQLAKWNNDVRQTIPEAQSLTVNDVLRWNGMLESAPVNAAELHSSLIELMKNALAEFSASRARRRKIERVPAAARRANRIATRRRRPSHSRRHRPARRKDAHPFARCAGQRR